MAVLKTEKQIEILHEHYNETYTVVELVWSQRNRVALYLYLLSGALLTPELQQGAVEKFVGKSGDVLLPTPRIFLLGLTGLLAMCVLLTQRTSFLDKLYSYLNGIERRMEILGGGVPLVAREQRFYQSLAGKTPLPYYRLYEFLLLSVAVWVVGYVWWRVGTDSEVYPPQYTGLYLLLSYGVLYVLASFLLTRGQIRYYADEINKKLAGDLSVLIPPRASDDFTYKLPTPGRTAGERMASVRAAFALGCLLFVIGLFARGDAHLAEGARQLDALKRALKPFEGVNAWPRIAALYTVALLLFAPLYLGRLRLTKREREAARWLFYVGLLLLLVCYYLAYMLGVSWFEVATYVVTLLALAAVAVFLYLSGGRGRGRTSPPGVEDKG